MGSTTTGRADRLPLPDRLSPEQQRAVDRISAGPRGTLFGPFVPLLRAPELMTRLQLVGEYLRFASNLPDHLRELAVLLVARDWDQHFEWGHHAPLARAAGLGDEIIEAIGTRRDPSGPPDVRAVWQLVLEVTRDHAVTDATFSAAAATLGDVAVVEVLATIGYYTTLAMTLNAARTPVPDDYEQLP